uniref:Uncharacterized protein n=1 Tax=Macaca mulatta TaxID=9544 RepID=A0A5F7ZEL3_MACMU
LLLLFLLFLLLWSPSILPTSKTQQDPGATEININQFPPLAYGTRWTGMSCTVSSVLSP